MSLGLSTRVLGAFVKKSLSIAVPFLLAILAFGFPTSPLSIAAAGQAPAGQAAAPAGTLSEKSRKAMADLDASAAEINKFVNDQPQDTTTASEPPAQLSSRFGSRPPRKCPEVTSSPTPAQAATLVQCTMDYESPQQAKLHQDIVVKLGAPRKPTNSDGWPRIDSRFPVVDLAANATVYVCGPILEAVMHNTGSNCDRYQFQSAPGICWRTLDGSYRCQINAGLPTDPKRSQPPPTTY